MGARRRLTLVLVAALAASGCRSKEREAPAPSPSATRAPDRLTEGEIPEGRERAFTLPLPLHSAIKARFGRSIHIASPHTREELSRFVLARIKDGKTSTAGNTTQYEKVLVSKDPSKTLSIHIRSAALGGEYKSQMVVEDVTPMPEEPGLTDADRWRKAGLTPEGKLIDPKHMQ